jgi:lysozyme
MSERRPASELLLSDRGTRVIADREGFELIAYLDSRGILTIGLGHTSAAGPPKVYEGMEITEDEAWGIFREDNKRFRKECLKLVRSPLTQYEFDALASFIFNLGSTQFAGSTALKLLNARDYEGCAEAMMLWNKPSEVISRRKAEVHQFLTGEYVARIS